MWDCGNLLDCFFYVQADKSCSVSDLMVCAYIYIYIYTVELQWLEHLWDHKK